MGFIGGVLQKSFKERVRRSELDRLLAAPIDIGKRSAAALICDFWGELVAGPFEFALDERGFRALTTELARADAARDAVWIRVGLEQAGHYHRTLQARLWGQGLEIVTFNPAQVKENRAQDLLRSLKSDARDLGAMAELLIRGKGRPADPAGDAIGIQAALSGHRRRKVKARTALKNQIHASLDLTFPGVADCFDDIFDTKLGRLILSTGLDPERVRRLGPERLRAFALRRGVHVKRAKASEIVDKARHALTLPAPLAEVQSRVLAADVGLLERIDEEIAGVEAGLGEVLPQTPAAILTTMPHVGVVRASSYGGALGDPASFHSAAQVYRLSGLVPKLYESAGRKRGSTSISREGRVELREAILELGKALRKGHPDFARYARELAERGKHSGVVACAVANRANRVAFAMMRDQRPFDRSRW